MTGDATRFDRRKVVRATGVLLGGGMLAGCTGGGSADPDDVSDEVRQRVDAWLADTGNYNGKFEDTDPNPPYDALVDVGAEGNGGNQAFAPPAWVVATGTTGWSRRAPPASGNGPGKAGTTTWSPPRSPTSNSGAATRRPAASSRRRSTPPALHSTTANPTVTPG